MLKMYLDTKTNRKGTYDVVMSWTSYGGIWEELPGVIFKVYYPERYRQKLSSYLIYLETL